MSSDLTSPLWSHLKKEDGGVLFLILIAVALFAALSFVIAGSNRSTGGDSSKEQSNLDAAEISQYTTTIETAITRLKISNGCTDEKISFENPFITGYTNPNSPVDKSCHVFDPSGGGVSFRNDWIKVLDSNYTTNPLYGSPLFSGLNDFSNNTTAYNYPDSATKDLALFFPFLKKSVCDAINIKMAGFSASDIPPYEQHGYWRNKWQGNYAETSGGIIGQWDSGTLLNGKRSGCFRATNTAGTPSVSPPDSLSGEYTYYHILVAR